MEVVQGDDGGDEEAWDDPCDRIDLVVVRRGCILLWDESEEHDRVVGGEEDGGGSD